MEKIINYFKEKYHSFYKKRESKKILKAKEDAYNFQKSKENYEKIFAILKVQGEEKRRKERLEKKVFPSASEIAREIVRETEEQEYQKSRMWGNI